MRKALTVLTLAATAVAATSAQAARYVRQPANAYAPAQVYVYNTNPAAPAEATTGVVAGTVVGLGVAEGWWGATAAGAALPATAAGAAVVGGVAGIGAVALIDAAVQPCRGFAAILGANREYCADVNGVRVQQARR